jgi:hypothetical protein
MAEAEVVGHLIKAMAQAGTREAETETRKCLGRHPSGAI